LFITKILFSVVACEIDEVSAYEADTTLLAPKGPYTFDDVIYDAVIELIAQDEVPNNDPVNPWVALTDPVTCTVDPEANIKLLLLKKLVPLPTIKADSADDDMLYWPCTCW